MSIYNPDIITLIYGSSAISNKPNNINELYYIINNPNDNISINNNTGILYFNNNINVGKYEINVNNYIVTLIVKPFIIYNNFTPIMQPIGKYLFYCNIDNIIDENTGIINISDVGFYNLNITYILNDISNSTIAPITIYPSIKYINNTSILEYGLHNFSEVPIVSPINGYFCLLNYHIGIDINSNNGIINFNNVNIGYYELDIKYTVNNISVLTKYYLTIKPLFGIGNGIYSYNLLNSFIKIQDDIDNIQVENYINNLNLDCGSYKLDVIYTINNVSCNKIYNFIVNPEFKYINNELILEYGTSCQSESPIFYKSYIDNNSFFSLQDKNINIDSSGIIYFNDLLEINIYNLIIKFTKNNCYNITNYKLIVKPKINLIPHQIIFYGDKLEPINENYTLQEYQDVGNYNINVIMTINDISNCANYSFDIIPNIKYKNDSIFYQTYNYSNKPIIFPENEGTFFSDNLPNTIILNKESGVIESLKTTDVGLYNINVYLKPFNSMSIYTLEVKPIFYYKNNIIHFIYGSDEISEEPIIIPEFGSFEESYIDLNKFSINSKGVISKIKYLDVGIYELKLCYNYNNICTFNNITIIIDKLELIPNFKSIDKIYDGNNNANVECDYEFISYNATYYNELVENNKIINIIITEVLSNNYFVKDTKITGNILPIILNPLFIAKSKIFDETYFVEIETECLYIKSYDASFIDYNAGYDKSIEIKNIIVDKNYTISSDIYYINANIYKAPIIPVFECIDKIYDKTNNANIILTNYKNCISYYNGTYITNNVGYHEIIIDDIIISNNNYYIKEKKNIYGNILPKLLDITIDTKVKIYDETTKANIILISDISECLILNFDANYENKNVGYNKKIIINNIILSNTNYYTNELITYSDILPKNITLDFKAEDKIFDNTNNIIVKGTIIENHEDVFIDSFNAYLTNDNEVKIENIILGGSNLSNYNYIYRVNKPKMLKKEIKIEFKAINKIFDNKTHAIINHDSKIIKKYDANFIDINVGINKIINITNIILHSSYENYYISNTQTNANIEPKSIIINVLGNDKIYDSYNEATITIESIKGIYSHVYVINYNAEFIDCNVGVNKPIKVSNIILSDSNYFSPDIYCHANILSKEIYNDFSCVDKIYNGSTIAEIKSNLDIKSYKANFNDPNVGINKIINITDIILNSSNYYISDCSIYGNINPILLEISFLGNSKEYDETTYIDIISDNDLILSFDSNFEDCNVGLNKTIVISNIKLKSSNYYILENYKTYGNIYPKKIIPDIICCDKEYDESKNAILKYNNITISGMFYDENVGIKKPVKCYSTGVVDSNYYINYDEIKICGNIYPKTLIHNFIFNDKIYDKTNKVNNILFDNILSYTAYFENINVGYQKILVNNVISKNKNYKYNDSESYANIIPRNINFYFDILNKEYDGNNNLINIKVLSSDKLENDEVYIESFTGTYENSYVVIKNIKLGGKNSNNYKPNDFYITKGTILPTELKHNIIIKDKIYDKKKIANIEIESLIPNIYIDNFEALYDDYNVGNNKPITIKNIIIMGINKNYYKISNKIVFGNILPKPINLIKLNYNNFYINEVINDDDVYITNFNTLDGNDKHNYILSNVIDKISI